MLSHATIDREANALDNTRHLTGPIGDLLAHFRERKAHVRGAQVYLECTVDGRALTGFHLGLAKDQTKLAQYAATKGLLDANVRRHFTSANTFHGESPAVYQAELQGHGHVIQGRFDKALADLERTGVKELLESCAVGTRPVKRMRPDETEGEWDYGRRNDDFPFLRMAQTRKEFPIVEIIFPLCNSAGIKSESVSQFGARCFALAAVLERAGYRVAITGEDWIQPHTIHNDDLKQALGNDYRDGMRFSGACHRVIVRSANEYGDTQSASIFGSCEFYRRTLFSLIYNAQHYVHGLCKSAQRRSVQGGYGMPIYSRPLATKPGQIFVDQTTMEKLFSSDTMTASNAFKDRIEWALKCDNTRAEQAS